MDDLPPQFSSSDRIKAEESFTCTPDQINVNELEFNSYFEIQETVEWIRANDFKRVALQFPDELLNSSAKVAFKLEEALNFKPYILADTSYGSCCVDDVAAQHVSADCIVHYGDACLSKTERGRAPVKYVLPKTNVNFDRFAEKLSRFLGEELNSRTVTLLCDVSLMHVTEALHKKFISIVGEKHGSTNFNADFSTQIDIQTDCILFAGSSHSKRALLLTLTNPSRPFYVYDPSLEERDIALHNFETNKQLRRRLFLVEKAKDAQIVGIVVGTVNVADYLRVLDRMKFLCKNAGKKYYVLYVGKLNVAKLSNFADIDLFVLLSCPFGVVFDCSDYFKPIVTAFEFEVACSSEQFWMAGEGWRPEPSAVLKERITERSECASNLNETDYSLTEGRLRNLNFSDIPSDSNSLIPRSEAYQLQPVTAENRFRDRSWKGLEEHLGETPVSEIKEGRRGVASAYEDEKT